MFYTVLEIQEDANGNHACLNTIYTTYADALAKYYTICAAAVKSAIPHHSAHVLRSDGIITDGRVFKHTAASEEEDIPVEPPQEPVVE